MADTKNNNLRKSILENSYKCGACHIGSALSAVEILQAIYKVKGKDDRFVFSKASGVCALYAVLADRGVIPKRKVAYYLKHYPLASKSVPGVLHSVGSVAHGLNVACGIALANRKEKVFVLMSDGECQEGSTWEAVLFSAHWKLKNLIAICDRNLLQACDETEKVMKLEPLEDKFRAFNWSVKRINGHNENQIKNVLKNWKSDKPKMLICDTIKGKGVDFMEGDYRWHYWNLSRIQLNQALKQL